MARPRSDIEPRIIEAARTRFLDEGVEGASLRQIASDAGTNIGMIYYYFPTKDDLFFAVVEEVYVGLLKDFEEALEPNTNFEERIRRLYRRIGHSSETELMTVRLIVREVLLSSTRLERLISRFMHGHIPLVMATLADGAQKGVVNATLPIGVLMTSTLALGVVPQMIRRLAGSQLPSGAFPEGDALPDVLLEVLLAGIGTGTTSSHRDG